MRYVIIGGGGFGVELYTYILDDIQSGRLPNDCKIGVIDNSLECELITKIPQATYLGQLENFIPDEGDLGLIAIGSVLGRKKNYELAKEKKLKFGSFIHLSAWVAKNASINQGVIIGPNSVVSAFAVILENVVLNVFCGVGHGAVVGAHSIMGPYSVINGDASLGEGCLLGSRATLFPKVSLGNGCIVDAHTAIKVSVGNHKIISVRGQYIELDNRFSGV